MAKLEIDQEELTWTTKDTAQFIKKNKDTALRLHGLMNAADKTELQQNILGQLYTSLKILCIWVLFIPFWESTLELNTRT